MNWVTALVIALALTFVAAACGEDSAPAPPHSAAFGHIQGTFMLQAGPTPTCRAATASPNCERFTQPIVGATIDVQDSTGHIVATTTTSVRGVFDFSLRRGTYTVVAPQASEPGTYHQTVVLAAGGTVSVTLGESEP